MRPRRRCIANDRIVLRHGLGSDAKTQPQVEAMEHTPPRAPGPPSARKPKPAEADIHSGQGQRTRATAARREGTRRKHRAAESSEGCTGQDMTRHWRLGSVRQMSDRWELVRCHVQDGVPRTALARETGIGRPDAGTVARPRLSSTAPPGWNPCPRSDPRESPSPGPTCPGRRPGLGQANA